MKKLFAALCLISLSVALPSAHAAASETPKPNHITPAWPEISREAKPWTFWWWMGSAVDRENVSRLLEIYSGAGLGGVHIIPIYGARGWESKYIEFLSPQWMEMLKHTVNEAGRLGMGVDMSTGTGWPFGGPHVTPETASSKLVLESFGLNEGGKLDRALDMRALQAAVAHSEDGGFIDLTGLVDSAGRLNWTAPAGRWKIHAAYINGTGQKVKRAAPGGAGLVMDHFSRTALDGYLRRFDEAIESSGTPLPRAFYNDSYEVYGANWTGDFFAEFERRRGYDLRRRLPELTGGGRDDSASRVRCDFRETLSDLLLERFAIPWTQWSRAKKCLTRYQAHGSPGNLLDLYAAADIPETEAFGPSGFDIPGLPRNNGIPKSFGKPNVLMMKFASSASHVTGKKLTSSESCTWLGEHFTVPLSKVKPELDQLFTAGINHVVFHGAAYSPLKAKWPGWLFYASVNFGPTNTFYRDFPKLTGYIARVQSFLQSGRPDNDTLLYWPIHDLYSDSAPERLERQLTVHDAGEWLHGSEFGKTAERLLERGYTFDYISDRLLSNVAVKNGQLISGGAAWRALVIPKCRRIPAGTMKKILNLAAGGARVIYIDGVPSDVPGLGSLDARRAELKHTVAAAKITVSATGSTVETKTGKGSVITGVDLEAALRLAGVAREPIVDNGIKFIREKTDGGRIYFVSNLGPKTLDGWVTLATPLKSASIFDPLHETAGDAKVRSKSDGTQVHLQLAPGESVILRTFDKSVASGSEWKYFEIENKPVEITGQWDVRFTGGGPDKPDAQRVAELKSWTEFGGRKVKYFSGTAVYTIEFDAPASGAEVWTLDLGRVAESARVKLNDTELGTLWCVPFRVRADGLSRSGKNKLEIEVTNLSANRIIQMEKKGAQWKYFNDANVLDVNYAPFDASKWTPLESGLIGPVRLYPVRFKH